jgi:hypothetical protein
MPRGGVYLKPVPQGASLDELITPVLPEAVQQLLEPYVDRLGPTPAKHLLGVNSPRRLSDRPDKLLSDYLLAMTRFVPDALLETMEGQTSPRPEGGCIRVPDLMFTHMPALQAQLFRREVTLSGMGWPLTHPRTFLEITAEDLPAWGFDPATDFAWLVRTETYVCDLRVQRISVQTKPLLTRVDLAQLSPFQARVRLLLDVYERQPVPNAKQALIAAQQLYANDLDGRPELLKPSNDELRRVWTEVRKRYDAQMRAAS